MSPMLEKIARAIGDEISGYDTMLANKREWIDRRGIDHRGDPADVNGPYKDDCVDIARAALLAMREPIGRNGEEIWWGPCGEIMKETGLKSVPVTVAQKSFTAMIDAILKEGGE